MDNKQIEKMSKIIEKTFSYAKIYCDDKYEPFELEVYPEEIAQALYNAGYRKIDKGSVVLTEEEYNEFRQTIINLSQEHTKKCDEMNDKIIKARKQAVKEFANALKSKMVERDYMGVKYKQGVFSDNEIDEIAKEFGVEL